MMILIVLGNRTWYFHKMLEKLGAVRLDLPLLLESSYLAVYCALLYVVLGAKSAYGPRPAFG